MLDNMRPIDPNAPEIADELFYTKNLGLLIHWSHCISVQTVEEMEISGMALGTGYFILGLLHMQDENGRMDNLGTRSGTAAALLRKLLCQHFLCHLGACGGDLVLLFCFPRATRPMQQEYLDAENACKDFTEKYAAQFPGQPFTMILSQPFQGYEAISREYAGLMDRLNYILFMGELPPLVRMEPAQQYPPQNPQYTDSDETARLAVGMAAAISRRQHQEIAEAEAALLDHLFSGNGYSLKPVYFQLYVFLCSFLKQLELQAIVDRRFTQRQDFFRSLTDAPSYRAFRTRLQALIQTVLDFYDNSTAQSLSGAARLQKVRSYCQTHYVEVGLTVSSLASLFGISQPQLSASFKKQYGESLLAYLNGLRIGEVRHLLVTTNKTQAEIAALCGFSNVTTMQRLFGKLEHCTPGQYRRRH